MKKYFFMHDADSSADVLLDQDRLVNTPIVMETRVNATAEMQTNGFQELEIKFQKYIDSVQEHLINEDDRIICLNSMSNIIYIDMLILIRPTFLKTLYASGSIFANYSSIPAHSANKFLSEFHSQI